MSEPSPEREGIMTEVAEEELLSSLMGRDGEDGPVIEHPLLLAALAQRHRDRGDRLIDHPLMLAALMRRREEEDDTIMENPLLLAAMARLRLAMTQH